MKMPNFFIVGAPKCGTTALSQYLSEHPQAFMSNPKEPFYWCFDAPGLRRYTLIESFDSYKQLFQDANDKHIAVGEGSTEYLRSDIAIEKILEFDGQARFIVMLRNPIDLVYSFHGTQLFTLSEDEPDFEKAWRLQELRSCGEAIPKKCLDVRLVRYAEVGRLGQQLDSFMCRVPEQQRLIILFDDFVADTRAVYERVCSFLRLANDARQDFPPVHEARAQRFPVVHRLIRRPPALIAKPVMVLRRTLNRYKSGPVRWLKSHFSRTTPRQPMRPEFRRELQEFFQPEIDRMCELLGQDLSNWK